MLKDALWQPFCRIIGRPDLGVDPTLATGAGLLDLTAANGEVTLVSPSALALGADESNLLVLGVTADHVQRIVSIAVEGRLSDGTIIELAAARPAADLVQTAAGLSVPLVRPAAPAPIDQIRIALRLRGASEPLRVRHLALYPSSNSNIASP